MIADCFSVYTAHSIALHGICVVRLRQFTRKPVRFESILISPPQFASLKMTPISGYEYAARKQNKRRLASGVGALYFSLSSPDHPHRIRIMEDSESIVRSAGTPSESGEHHPRISLPCNTAITTLSHHIHGRGPLTSRSVGMVLDGRSQDSRELPVTIPDQWSVDAGRCGGREISTLNQIQRAS